MSLIFLRVYGFGEQGDVKAAAETRFALSPSFVDYLL